MEPSQQELKKEEHIADKSSSPHNSESHEEIKIENESSFVGEMTDNIPYIGTGTWTDSKGVYYVGNWSREIIRFKRDELNFQRTEESFFRGKATHENGCYFEGEMIMDLDTYKPKQKIWEPRNGSGKWIQSSVCNCG